MRLMHSVEDCIRLMHCVADCIRLMHCVADCIRLMHCVADCMSVALDRRELDSAMLALDRERSVARLV